MDDVICSHNEGNRPESKTTPMFRPVLQVATPGRSLAVSDCILFQFIFNYAIELKRCVVSFAFIMQGSCTGTTLSRPTWQWSYSTSPTPSVSCSCSTLSSRSTTICTACAQSSDWFVVRTGATQNAFREWRCASSRSDTSLVSTSTSSSARWRSTSSNHSEAAASSSSSASFLQVPSSSDDQPLQREDLYIPMVLVRVSGASRCRQYDEVAVSRPLLARAGTVRAKAASRFRRNASRAGHSGQVHRELPAPGRHVHHSAGRTKHGGSGCRRGALRIVEQLQSGAPPDRGEVWSQEDEQESTERTSAGSDVTNNHSDTVVLLHCAPVAVDWAVYVFSPVFVLVRSVVRVVENANRYENASGDAGSSNMHRYGSLWSSRVTKARSTAMISAVKDTVNCTTVMVTAGFMTSNNWKAFLCREFNSTESRISINAIRCVVVVHSSSGWRHCVVTCLYGWTVMVVADLRLSLKALKTKTYQWFNSPERISSFHGT